MKVSSQSFIITNNFQCHFLAVFHFPKTLARSSNRCIFAFTATSNYGMANVGGYWNPTTTSNQLGPTYFSLPLTQKEYAAATYNFVSRMFLSCGGNYVIIIIIKHERSKKTIAKRFEESTILD